MRPSSRVPRPLGLPRRLASLALLLAVLAACGGEQPPPWAGGLSISYPPAGHTVAGTFAVAARGVGGSPVDLTFELGGATVPAAPDGTAYLDARPVADGPATLRATATVAGRQVEASVPVKVANDVPGAGLVGPDGGALRTGRGSYVGVPAGAFPGGASVAVSDTTQEEILDEFGVDYEALGVTFLGALVVDTSGAAPSLPVSVDLAGWAEAVQPGQEVVMFALAPDANGDGVGELMLAAGAQATPTGSVITRPIPSAEVYGFGSGGASPLRAQQATSARPGQLVTVAGRGFNPVAPLSTVARYGDPLSPTAETLAYAAIVEPDPFDPLQEVTFAVPATASGAVSVHLNNLNTGYRTGALSVSFGALGSGGEATWESFVEQVEAAALALTTGRDDLSGAAAVWLGRLAPHGSATLRAMAANSGLVSAASLAALKAIGTGGPSGEQRLLVARHALVLDAMASSEGVPAAAAEAAADLATLLMTTAHGSQAPLHQGLSAQQSGSGPSCSSGAATPSAGVSWGSPVFNGMGAAPTGGSCGAGGASGGGGTGPAGLGHDVAALAASLGQDGLATTSLRRGTFKPVAGAIVQFFRQGTWEQLSPFTAITDAAGFFSVPFLPPGEPFTARAIHPMTQQVAVAHGVSLAAGVITPVQLMFTSTAGGGGLDVSIAIEPVPDASFADTVYLRFVPEVAPGAAPAVHYFWEIDGRRATISGPEPLAPIRGFGRSGTYTATLVVTDEAFNVGSAAREFTVDLAHDYWGSPPQRVNASASGEPSDGEIFYAGALSHDGRYVAFASSATNLAAAPTSGAHVFLKDMLTGEVEVISEDGYRDHEGVGDPLVSADARLVAYRMSRGSGGAPKGIAVRDRSTGTFTTLVAPDAKRSNDLRAMSADGRWLALTSSSLNDPERPAYVADLAADPVGFTRIGRSLADDRWLNVTPLAFSAEGRYLTLMGPDGLAAGDANGREDVLRLDLQSGLYELVSVAQDGTQADGFPWAYGQVTSADGRFVVFQSERTTTLPRATENDTGNDRADDVYLKDMVTGELILISTNAKDESGSDDSILPVISADGRYVAFGSYATNLAPEHDPTEHFYYCYFEGDCVLGVSYVKDLATGRVALVTVALDGGWPDDWDQIEPQISGDGRWVGFYAWSSNFVEDGRPDFREYYRAENPLWEAP